MSFIKIAIATFCVFVAALAGCNGPAGPLSTVGRTAEAPRPTSYPPGPKSPADVNALLGTTERLYRRLTSYSCLFAAERTSGGGLDSSDVTGKFIFQKPNLFIWSGTETFRDATTRKVTIVVKTHMVCDGSTLLISTRKGVKKDLRLPAPATPQRMRDVLERIPFWDGVAHLVLGDQTLLNLLPANPIGANSPSRFSELGITELPTWRPSKIDAVPVALIRFAREDFTRAPGKKPSLKYGFYQNFGISPDAVIQRFETTQFYGGVRDRNKVDYSNIRFNPTLSRTAFVVPAPATSGG